MRIIVEKNLAEGMALINGELYWDCEEKVVGDDSEMINEAELAFRTFGVLRELVAWMSENRRTAENLDAWFGDAVFPHAAEVAALGRMLVRLAEVAGDKVEPLSLGTP